MIVLTQRSLVDQLDDDLLSAASGEVSTAPSAPGTDDPTGRRFALILYDTTGQQLTSVPSGYAANPDPLPNIPSDDPTTLPQGRIVLLSSLDGSLSYQAIMVHGHVGPPPSQVIPVIAVFAAPMDQIDGSISVLTRTLAIVGLVVLALILIIGWFIIRRDLRPLENMTTTAERISDGDLSQRVGVPDDGSEVGRLGNAFDAMLDQIQALFDSQHSALVAKERSELQLRRFIADASHELRTP